MDLKFKRIASFEVRAGDINYGGHMGNEKALLLFQDARLKFLKSLGYTETDIGEGKGTIMVEAHVYYKKEVFMYEKLYANIEVRNIGKNKFELFYAILRENDDTVVIQGSTLQFGFDYETHRITHLPEEFLNKLKKNT